MCKPSYTGEMQEKSVHVPRTTTYLFYFRWVMFVFSVRFLRFFCSLLFCFLYFSLFPHVCVCTGIRETCRRYMTCMYECTCTDRRTYINSCTHFLIMYPLNRRPSRSAESFFFFSQASDCCCSTKKDDDH